MCDSCLVSLYGLVDPQDGRLRYIGRASDPVSRLCRHLIEARACAGFSWRELWLRHLLLQELCPQMFVFERVAASEAKEAERALIREAQENGVQLVNTLHTPVGWCPRFHNQEGAVGLVASLKPGPSRSLSITPLHTLPERLPGMVRWLESKGIPFAVEQTMDIVGRFGWFTAEDWNACIILRGY